MRNIGLRNIMLVVAAFLLSLQLMAQQRTIIGTVVDSRDNSAMVGVTVLEKGTTNGTVTDIDGKFSLKITTKNPVLVFSYVGYKSIEVNVGNQSVLNVVMQEDVETLEEVVVIGYGTMKPPCLLLEHPSG